MRRYPNEPRDCQCPCHGRGTSSRYHGGCVLEETRQRTLAREAPARLVLFDPGGAFMAAYRAAR